MRNFIGDVKRCDEMERKLRFLVDQLKKEDDFDELYGEGVAAMAAAPPTTLDQLEVRLEQEEQELLAANSSAVLLERNRNELLELKHVLEKDEIFFHEAGAVGGGQGVRRDGDKEDAPLLGSTAGDGVNDDFGGGKAGGDEEAFFQKATQSSGLCDGRD